MYVYSIQWIGGPHRSYAGGDKLLENLHKVLY
jgi:hypothetical protein